MLFQLFFIFQPIFLAMFFQVIHDLYYLFSQVSIVFLVGLYFIIYYVIENFRNSPRRSMI